MAPRLDITVHGATGVTGRDMLAHLLRHAPRATTLAVSGRSRARLAQAVADARRAAGTPTAACRPVAATMADNEDPATLAALARSTRVVLDAAGPYDGWVRPLLHACVDAGTHHLDLGGELHLLRALVDELHEPAVRAGVALVPLAGYESLPFDLAVLTGAHELHDRHGERATRADVVLAADLAGEGRRPRNYLSSGSLGTFVNQLRGDDGAQADPACLLPAAARDDEHRAGGRPALSLRREAWAGAIVGPMFPTPFLNPPLVLRTAHLLAAAGGPYVDPFAYREGAAMTIAGRSPLVQTTVGLGLAAAQTGTRLLFSPPARPARAVVAGVVDRARRRLPDGPTEQAQEAMRFGLRARVRGTRHAVEVVVDGHGHPGYRATARMAAQAALVLAGRGPAGPAGTGLATPATALGRDGLRLLRPAGLRSRVLPAA